jgi:dolichol-phosphate mannosyltransferase
MYLNKKNIKFLDKGLSVIIPVYNEEKNIPHLVKKIFYYLKKINFEIIIVDDNSEDFTEKKIKQAINRYKKIKYIKRVERIRDLSKSCQLGIKKALYKNILIMDADLQHDPKYILPMMKLFYIKKLDVVVGARKFNNPNHLNTGQRCIRYIFSKVLVYITNIFFGVKTNDPMSGFFLFKKSLFINNEKQLYLRGYKILADMLYSPMKNIKVNDYFIRFNKRNRGISKMNMKVFFHLFFFYFLILKKIFLIKKNNSKFLF